MSSISHAYPANSQLNSRGLDKFFNSAMEESPHNFILPAEGEFNYSKDYTEVRHNVNEGDKNTNDQAEGIVKMIEFLQSLLSRVIKSLTSLYHSTISLEPVEDISHRLSRRMSLGVPKKSNSPPRHQKSSSSVKDLDIDGPDPGDFDG